MKRIRTKISVVVATCNRPKDVRETVKSLLNQSREPLEIILIDDASYPPLELNLHSDIDLKLKRFDENVGSSGARNYGIKISRGEYIAFTDDDALADKYWLEEVQKSFDRGADIVGGSIEPLYLAKPPNWWSEKLFGSFVGIGNKNGEQIWEGNMAVRKELFNKIGYFRTILGRKGRRLLSGEGLQFQIRAKKMGSVFLFNPEAKVFHKVPPNRMTLRYILRWSYYWGKSLKLIVGYQPLEPCGVLAKNMVVFPFLSDTKKRITLARIATNLGYLL